MAYDPGFLDAALSAAVGNDPLLIAELRGAFHDSASAMIATLRTTRSDPEWRMTALRLEGLAASFGAVTLMDCASRAAAAQTGDKALLGEIEQAVAAFEA